MFRRLISRFQHFMLGRRGIDSLGIALLVSYLILSLLLNFMRFHLAPYLVVWALMVAALVCFFLRFFSRDLQKREAENRKFSKFWSQLRSRFRDRKTHVFFKCPACKNTLRVPKGRGNITVTCPVCREQIKRRT